MIKKIIFAVIIFIVGANIGFFSCWFLAPCPKENLVYNFWNTPIPIPKGIFSKTDKSRWMTWEEFKESRNK